MNEKRLFDLREYADLSQKDLANKRGVTQQTYSLWEKKELNKKEIGSRIKELRENKKLTLRDLASELNTTSSTISAYETGKTLILTAFAYQICIKYDVSLDWLCGKVK